jgi:hypothetical protein
MANASGDTVRVDASGDTVRVEVANSSVGDLVETLMAEVSTASPPPAITAVRC